jgi:hypothetical protein
VIAELNYTGMTRIALAESYIHQQFTTKGILADGLKFKEEEISRIKKILGIQ